MPVLSVNRFSNRVLPERPLLKLPAFEEAELPKRRGGGSDLEKPSPERQGQRFHQKFALLKNYLDHPEQFAQYHEDPQAIAPERAIVFEVAGSITEFYEKCSQIGFELLASEETIIEPNSLFFYPKQDDKLISGRIYFAMPSKEALKNFLALWNIYQNKATMPRGRGVWKQVFELLRDVRAWGPMDRLTDDVIKDWQEKIKDAIEEKARFEVELWYRNNEVSRNIAFASLREALAECNGTIVSNATIHEIRYHAALVELPVANIRQFLLEQKQLSMVNLQGIMYIRPQSMASFPVEHRQELIADYRESSSDGLSPPIAALFDGLPVENHSYLKERLEIDDPEELDPPYEVSARIHGTQMASLIIHGDLERKEPPIRQKLYVRRIMEPYRTQTNDGEAWDERTPCDQLLTDYFYRAVQRLKEGKAGAAHAFPDVFMINVSLGDKSRMFNGTMSPWARLLDYLAYHYKLLFIVSAGNVVDSLPLKKLENDQLFEDAEFKEKELYASINLQKTSRQIISPAESINALTVGAAHHDSINSKGSMSASSNVNLIIRKDLPNLSSRLGLGYRQNIKPDLLADGGKELVSISPYEGENHVRPVKTVGRAFGLLAAAAYEGDLSRTALTSGTSAATALVTRAGHLIFDALNDSAQNTMLQDTPAMYYPLIVKALLVHSAKWGEGANVLHELFSSASKHHKHTKDNISRYVGHGVLDTSRTIECSANRATLVGYGKISAGSALLCRIPLPPSLEGVREPRVVTVTLAWFTPINARHQNYRSVTMEAKPDDEENEYALGVEREKLHPDFNAIARGTVFHDRRTGKKAVSYIDEGFMIARVSARATAGKLADDIPFAMAVSIEVDESSEIQIYDEIRQALLTEVETQIKP